MSKHLTLVIHALHGGGAEKSMASLANHWTERGHKVTLITLDAASTDVFYLSPAVRRIALDVMGSSPGLWRALWNNYRRWRGLRRAIREAQGEWVISSTEKTNVLTILACLGTNARVIACERTDPRRHQIGPVWSGLRRWTYPLSSGVVVQTEDVGQFVRQFVRRKPVHVVPNCVWPETVPKNLPSYHCRRQRIVGIGRLGLEKGFDILIKAFSHVAADFPEWKLVIIGEGAERDRLKSLIDAHQLSGRACLLGWHDEPSVLLRESQVFVLPSRYEGFPNALLEAMAHGVAPVAFDCGSGPREIIRHDVDGLLVPPEDVKGLAQALSSLLSDAARRERLAAAAREVTGRFGLDAFLQRWDTILRTDSGSTGGS